MQSELERRHGNRGPANAPIQRAALAPGKTTRVQAELGGPVQLARAPGAPIQRQSDGKPPPPAPVYQYAAGTTHFNDCGPASMLMIVRMLGADYEAKLLAWIAAHRPTGETSKPYLQHYGYDAATAAVGTQEQLDVARLCSSRSVGADEQLPVPGGTDTVLTVAALRNGVGRLLRLIGADIPERELNGLMQTLMPLGSESGETRTSAGGAIGASNIDDPANRSTVLDFLRRHCAGDEAVIAQGVPQRKTDHGPEDVAWGWGGDRPSGDGRNVGQDYEGHFVVVYSYDAARRQFTVLDPSFAEPQQATEDQIVEFLKATGSSHVNLLTVPLASLRARFPATVAPTTDGTTTDGTTTDGTTTDGTTSGGTTTSRNTTGRTLTGSAARTVDAWVSSAAAAILPAVDPGRGGAAEASAPAPASGGGAPLPRMTLAKMERAFGADFSGVRVHEGDAAPRLGALAYARGDELHFAPGRYQPGTSAGDALIGHELAHVIQQREGRVVAPPEGDAVVEDARLEAEADREGARAAEERSPQEAVGPGVEAQPARAGAAAPAAGRAVQRHNEDGGGGGAAPQTSAGPIPPALILGLTYFPRSAVLVADWCKYNLLKQEEMRVFWASTPDPTRGEQLGEMAARLGRLEFMLGWIHAGGLSIQTDVGWENQEGTNASASKNPGDTSTNHGTFPGRYQALYDGGNGMPGYDWCGMFVGYLYSELLHLDEPGIAQGEGGLESWRGSDSVLDAAGTKTWPIRNTVAGAGFGTFTGWNGDPPRAGDVVVTDNQAVEPKLLSGGTDPRLGDHISMVERADPDLTSGYVDTIDGNTSLLPPSPVTGEHPGSHEANTVSGRRYRLGVADQPDPDSDVADPNRPYLNFHNNQSRIVCIVRITDRANNFLPPSTGTGATTTPAPTGADLLARLDAANQQLQAVLNAMAHTPPDFDSQGPVRDWVRAQYP